MLREARRIGASLQTIERQSVLPRRCSEDREWKHRLVPDASASPASIVAANAIICFGLMSGCKVSTADAVKAYLQSELKSLCATWVRLPREVWPDDWFWPSGEPRYRRPVVRLHKSLYGHPEAGSHWEKHLNKELVAMGGVPIDEFASTYVFPSYNNLALIVYVDDFVLAGDATMHDTFWQDLGKRVLIDDIGILVVFLAVITQH